MLETIWESVSGDVLKIVLAVISIIVSYYVIPAIKDDLIPCRAISRIPTDAKSVIVYLFPYYLGEAYYENSNISKYAFLTFS